MEKTIDVLTLDKESLMPFGAEFKTPLSQANKTPYKLPLSLIKQTVKTLKIYGFNLCAVNYQFLGLTRYHLAGFQHEQMPESIALIHINYEGTIGFSFVPACSHFFEAHHLDLSPRKAQDDIAAYLSTLLDP